MDFCKVILIGLLFVCFGCDGEKQEDVIPKSDYDELMMEYRELKNENQSNKSAIIDQAATLNNALDELSMISNQTLELRYNIEGGSAKISQAEGIQQSISSIREKIELYEKSLSNNAELKKTVTALKCIIIEKEKEIENLRGIIDGQRETIEMRETEISTQREQIDDQSVAIAIKNRELEKAAETQARYIYMAAVEFEAIASENVEISRRKNREKVSDYKKRIMKKAAEYYALAARMGHAEAKLKVEKMRHLL